MQRKLLGFNAEIDCESENLRVLKRKEEDEQAATFLPCVTATRVTFSPTVANAITTPVDPAAAVTNAVAAANHAVSTTGINAAGIKKVYMSSFFICSCPTLLYPLVPFFLFVNHSFV